MARTTKNFHLDMQGKKVLNANNTGLPTIGNNGIMEQTAYRAIKDIHENDIHSTYEHYQSYDTSTEYVLSSIEGCALCYATFSFKTPSATQSIVNFIGLSTSTPAPKLVVPTAPKHILIVEGWINRGNIKTQFHLINSHCICNRDSKYACPIYIDNDRIVFRHLNTAYSNMDAYAMITYVR